MNLVLTALTATVAGLGAYVAYRGLKSSIRFRDSRMALLSAGLATIAMSAVSGWYMCEFTRLRVLEVQTVQSLVLLAGFSTIVYSVRRPSPSIQG